MHNNPVENAWKVFHNVVSFPARVQGYLVNAMLNTIDRAQCDLVLRESAELQRRQEEMKKQSEGQQDGN